MRRAAGRIGLLVRAGSVTHRERRSTSGHQWSPVVTSGEEDRQVSRPLAQAVWGIQPAELDCGPEGQGWGVGAAEGSNRPP
jgi:hypothetical protein